MCRALEGVYGTLSVADKTDARRVIGQFDKVAPMFDGLNQRWAGQVSRHWVTDIEVCYVCMR